jgi:hypothetical protein
MVIFGAGQDPPLTTVPLPAETLEDPETPEEDEIPDEDDELVPDEVPAPDEPVPSVDRCGREAVMCANFAPITAAAAAESRAIRQVNFLTRRRPSSLARAACEY